MAGTVLNLQNYYPHIKRPFTTKWHRLASQGAFAEFRKELSSLQETLKLYSRMLADMAGVEDLTKLESE